MSMETSASDPGGDQVATELKNFEDVVRYFQPSPGDVPALHGIDICAASIPFNGVIGGDHIIYLDFKKRYDLAARIRAAQKSGRVEVQHNLERRHTRAGIVLADVSGHHLTDALLAVTLHQAFLLGSIYEMDRHGRITTRLFENLNTRFYRSSSVNRFVTMIYGEISEQGAFRFVSAAHPGPVVFSREYNRIVTISPSRLKTYPPLGTIPSREDVDRKVTRSALGYKERYTVNEINLMGHGDVMILYTDGLAEFGEGTGSYIAGHLEGKLREVKDLPAQEICQALREHRLSLHEAEDDISFVVIKRTEG